MNCSITIEELSKLTSSQVYGNPNHLIAGVASLKEASSHEASFLENARYESDMRQSRAGVIFISPQVPPHEGKNQLIVENPTLAFQKTIEYFLKPSGSGFQGIHPTAVIHEGALIGQGVSIGPYSVIDREVIIGSQTTIGSHVFIGAESMIGERCLIDAHVSIYDKCRIGSRVIIQSGAVIGSSGFGYHTDKEGKHHLLKQLGIVIIEDDVEIGANTTIDRARFNKTLIRRGSKIDNLVQIAHQVEIGEDNLIVSQVGIAGSTKTGKNVVIAGQVGIVGHVEIGDGVILAARSGVSKSLPRAGLYGGAPAIPFKEYAEQTINIKNIKKIIKKTSN